MVRSYVLERRPEELPEAIPDATVVRCRPSSETARGRRAANAKTMQARQLTGDTQTDSGGFGVYTLGSVRPAASTGDCARDRESSAPRSSATIASGLYGAMLAVVDDAGFGGDAQRRAVASRAGVSRGALYEYFSGGARQCFLATFEALMEEGLATVSRAYAEPRARGRAAGGAPSTPYSRRWSRSRRRRGCASSRPTPPGAAGAALRERAARRPRGAGSRRARPVAATTARMPSEGSARLLGGIRTDRQSRLRRRREAELPALAPELWSWRSVATRPTRPLPQVLRAAGAGARLRRDHAPRPRLFVALAKVVHAKGYSETTCPTSSPRRGSR